MPRKEHTLDVVFTVTGKVTIVANNRTEAKELIEKHVSLNGGEIRAPLPPGELQWHSVTYEKEVTK